MRPYRVLLALSEIHGLASWLQLANDLLNDLSEIWLRGMITIPENQSLTEGTTAARQLRDALDQLAHQHTLVHDQIEVRVDYQPLMRILDEARQLPVDLLLIQWQGPITSTGGLGTDEILRQSPCDVVLVCGTLDHLGGPVLLALRGGPNLSLGVRVAKALARGDKITLFHAAENLERTPAIGTLMQIDPAITRAVTTTTEISASILDETSRHRAVVMGATTVSPDAPKSRAIPLILRVFEQIDAPLVLVRSQQPEEYTFHSSRRRTRFEEDLSTRVDRWFAENTFHSNEFSDMSTLLALKKRQGVTISLGLPALNEAATIGSVIGTIKKALMDDAPLLDEIVLIDSNSTDDTVAIAQAAGIPVYTHPEILPDSGSHRGKGEALWKSLHVLKGDLIAWIDTDITNIHPRFVYGLIGPLLKRPQVQYVKGFYERPLTTHDHNQTMAQGGGRVTELVARPLLNLFYPELSGIIQPLSGEYAGRRTALESVPFFTGYGVETGLLIDLHERFGLDGIAQADLEERIHHSQSLVDLSKMSFAILQVFIARLEKRYAVSLLDKANRSIKLIAYSPERLALEIAAIEDTERPPIVTFPAYQKTSVKEAE